MESMINFCGTTEGFSYPEGKSENVAFPAPVFSSMKWGESCFSDDCWRVQSTVKINYFLSLLRFKEVETGSIFFSHFFLTTRDSAKQQKYQM